MMNEKSKPTVTVEDLLRLKRAERPSADFWAEFDRELRAKQLAALVEKRPWWSALPRRLSGLARYNLPLGATAVLAITLVSLRNYGPVMHAPNASHLQISTPVTATAVTRGDQVAASVPAGEFAPIDVSSDEQANADAGTPETSSSASEARLVPVIQMRAELAATANEDRPSARSIAENRAVAEALLGAQASGFETRAVPVKFVAQEPLAQISNPSETRRSRFAHAFAAAAVGTSPVPTARVASRLSDEQLYDTIHRFGASGNSVSFKF